MCCRLLDPAVSAAGLGHPAGPGDQQHVRAAESGVGARVYEVLPAARARDRLLEFLARADADAAATSGGRRRPRGIAAACRRLHAGPRFGNDFSIIAQAGRAAGALPPPRPAAPGRVPGPAPLWTEIGAALAAAPLPHRAVPQRPAGGELHRLGRRHPHRRLPARRQQRPELRARRHRGRGATRPRPDRGRWPARTSARTARRRWRPGCGSTCAVRHHLDALVHRAPRRCCDRPRRSSFDYWPRRTTNGHGR